MINIVKITNILANIVKKKVLIISYYWPPAGGPGVQRVVNFVKYLPQNGWVPMILTVRDGEYPALDYTLEGLIADNTVVIKTRSIEPFSLYKRLMGKKKEHKIDTYILNQNSKGWLSKITKWVRLNIFIPDARIGWYPFAVVKGKKIMRQEGIDLIYTCSPPHSVQLIGMALSRKYKVPWVADFRDPWSALVAYQGQHRSALTRKIDLWFEKRVLRCASRIVVTCHGLKRALEVDRIVASHKTMVITNGYDPETKALSESRKNDASFVIFYGGNLSDVRLPGPLLDAMEAVMVTGTSRNVVLRIAGSVGRVFWNLVKSKGLEDQIQYIGYVSHEEVLRQHAMSDMLLQVVDNVPSNHLFVSGKLFDYLGSKIPILAIGPKEGEVHQIIKETDSGFFFGYDEGQELTQMLTMVLNDQMDITKKFTFNNIEQYSRSKLTQKLAGVFDALTPAV